MFYREIDTRFQFSKDGLIMGAYTLYTSEDRFDTDALKRIFTTLKKRLGVLYGQYYDSFEEDSDIVTYYAWAINRTTISLRLIINRENDSGSLSLSYYSPKSPGNDFIGL
jgi:hypothetical protein